MVHPLHRGPERLVEAPYGHAEPERLESRAQRCTLQPPEPERETVQLGRPRRRVLERRHFDHGEVAASHAQIGDESDRALVEQRCDGEDESARREDPARDALDGSPRVAERDLARQQCVDDPVQLRGPERGLDPVQGAAEVDEPNPIASCEMRADQRRGCANGGVERSARALPRLLERVEQDHNIGGLLGVAVGHVQSAAPGARSPVDLPRDVARLKRPSVGEFDSVAARARNVCSQKRLHPQRGDEFAEPLLAGEGAHRQAFPKLSIPRHDSERVARPDYERTHA